MKNTERVHALACHTDKGGKCNCGYQDRIDAERYRWIRANRELFGEEISWRDDEAGYAAVYVSAEEMDSRIDAKLNPVL